MPHWQPNYTCLGHIAKCFCYRYLAHPHEAWRDQRDLPVTMGSQPGHDANGLRTRNCPKYLIPLIPKRTASTLCNVLQMLLDMKAIDADAELTAAMKYSSLQVGAISAHV